MIKWGKTREPDNSLPPSDKTAGQNVMEELFRSSDRGGEKKSEGVCGGLSS